MLKRSHVVKIGKTIKSAARLRGGGSALPGLIVEKLDPTLLKDTLSTLPKGVVVITGTNGKTTTTKMVVELLRAQGLTVFTNRSGSNFIRGVIASLLGEISDDGTLDADIAVLELDEAHAVHFVKRIRPRHSLLLNVMRDQLDRFGEIDHTAKLLQKVAEATTDGIVLNREDPLIRHIGDSLPRTTAIRYFGLDTSLRKEFPSDQELYKQEKASDVPHPRSGDVILKKLKGTKATFEFGTKAQPEIQLKLNGTYNVLNAAAALSLVRMIIDDDKKDAELLEALANVTPAFGRGEAVVIDGHPLEIVLVKNPAGFRLALKSYVSQPAATMIAINDNYADGRDMSWLWDVSYESLQQSGVHVVSGIRAYDMALRLQYNDVEVRLVDTSLAGAYEKFLKLSHTQPKRIYCTYTAMLQLRRLIQKTHDLEGAID